MSMKLAREQLLSRSRTHLFLSLREPAAFPPARWKGKVQGSGSDEHHALLNQDAKDEPAVSRGQLPPEWIKTVRSLEDLLQNLSLGVAQVDKLHAKHARPGFKDRSAEEAEIQRQTRLITDGFRAGQHLLLQLQSSTDPLQQDRLLANIRMGLATKLQEASSAFRRKQSVYLRQLRGSEVPLPDLKTAPGVHSNHPHAVEDDLQLLQATMRDDRTVANERVSEVNTIATSIAELAELFRDLSSMVIDQGTLLDRVDYNVEQMAVHAAGAAVELTKAASHQRKSGKHACILLLVLCIVALIIVIAMKRR